MSIRQILRGIIKIFVSVYAPSEHKVSNGEHTVHVAAPTLLDNNNPLFLACCWHGDNAGQRMMNLLSPKFSDAEFESRVAWMAERGCNTAHLILINGGDGEKSGYNLATDKSAAKTARARVDKLLAAGWHYIPWIITDDSAAYAKDLFANAATRVKALADAGLFEGASVICLGLEMDESGNEAQWRGVRDALKAVYSGPIATHHTSGKSTFASLGEIVMDQLDPSCTTAQIKSSVGKLVTRGFNVFGFEYSRHEDRSKAQAAIDAGAIGVGNW